MSIDQLLRPPTAEEEPRPFRRILGALLALAALFVVFLIVYLMLRETETLAELRVRDKRVDVRAGEGGTFIKGREGQALRAGDAVRTDDSGQAQIDYFGGSAVRLDRSTTLVIDALLDGSGGRRIAVEQTAGRAWHRVEGLTTSEDRYEVRTPNAIASVRGTIFGSDLRFFPVVYYFGVENEVDIRWLGGDRFVMGPGDCYRVDEDGVRPCTEHERLDVMFNPWVDEMRTLDGLAASGPTPTPTASPSPTPGPLPAIRGTGGGGGVATATPTPPPPRTRKPSITPDETEESDATDSPEPPTPPTPTTLDE